MGRKEKQVVHVKSTPLSRVFRRGMIGLLVLIVVLMGVCVKGMVDPEPEPAPAPAETSDGFDY